MTMFDSRTKLSEQVVAEVRRYFGSRVYDTIIPRTVRLSEAPGFGVPITIYDPSSKGAKAYRRLAKEFLKRETIDDPLPEEEPPSVIAIERMEAPGDEEESAPGPEEGGDLPTQAWGAGGNGQSEEGEQP
jgi:chromosome partitioning protein